MYILIFLSLSLFLFLSLYLYLSLSLYVYISIYIYHVFLNIYVHLCDIGMTVVWCLGEVWFILKSIFSKKGTHVQKNKGYRMHYSKLRLYISGTFDRPWFCWHMGYILYVFVMIYIYIYVILYINVYMFFYICIDILFRVYI